MPHSDPLPQITRRPPGKETTGGPFSSAVVKLKTSWGTSMKMRALVATPTALFAGSVGLCNPGRAHGSQQALTVATNAISIRRGELEEIIVHL